MWMVIVVPPLTTALTVKRPARCDACGAHNPFVIHQRIARAIPYMEPRASSARQPWLEDSPDSTVRREHSYLTVRFRCSKCRATVTARAPDRIRGTRSSHYIDTLIMTLYCLGFPAASIYEELYDRQIIMSRSSLYRALQRSHDYQLRQLHRLNKHRLLRSHNVRVYTNDHFTLEVPEEHGERLADIVEVIPPDEESFGEVIGILQTVVLCWIIGDFHGNETRDWLSSRMKRIGGAGVWSYARRGEIMKEFGDHPPSIEDRHIAYSSARDLTIPADKNSSRVRTMVRSLIRQHFRYEDPETWEYEESRDRHLS